MALDFLAYTNIRPSSQLSLRVDTGCTAHTDGLVWNKQGRRVNIFMNILIYSHAASDRSCEQLYNTKGSVRVKEVRQSHILRIYDFF